MEICILLWISNFRLHLFMDTYKEVREGHVHCTEINVEMGWTMDMCTVQ